MTESNQLRGGGGRGIHLSLRYAATWGSDLPSAWVGFRTALLGRRTR